MTPTIRNLVLAIVVALVTLLACILVGSILIAATEPMVVAAGSFLKVYGGIIAILAGIWYYFANNPARK